MENAKVRIEKAKEGLKKAETEKTRKETEKEQAIKKRDELIEEMKEEGVSPETIGGEISKLEKEIQENLEQVEELIPEV